MHPMILRVFPFWDNRAQTTWASVATLLPRSESERGRLWDDEWNLHIEHRVKETEHNAVLRSEK